MIYSRITDCTNEILLNVISRTSQNFLFKERNFNGKAKVRIKIRLYIIFFRNQIRNQILEIKYDSMLKLVKNKIFKNKNSLKMGTKIGYVLQFLQIKFHWMSKWCKYIY